LGQTKGFSCHFSKAEAPDFTDLQIVRVSADIQILCGGETSPGMKLYLHEQGGCHEFTGAGSMQWEVEGSI